MQENEQTAETSTHLVQETVLPSTGDAPIAIAPAVVSPTFEVLAAETVCDCLASSFHDADTMFIKKIDGPEMRDKDFITYWEKGRRPPVEDCSEICGYKGVSIDLLSSPSDIPRILQIYKKTLSIKPNGKTKYITFSIKSSGGRCKHTPTEHSNVHHDFYKSDAFNISDIKLDSITPIL